MGATNSIWIVGKTDGSTKHSVREAINMVEYFELCCAICKEPVEIMHMKSNDERLQVFLSPHRCD